MGIVQKVAMTASTMIEIIIIGFGESHTNFLARAALARLQEELGIVMVDVAMVLRGVDGDVSVQQTLNRDARRNGLSVFWENLADLFFTPESSVEVANGAFAEKTATIGVDPALASSLYKQLQTCESALLVRTRDLVQREKVAGLLQGFDGEHFRVPLALL